MNKSISMEILESHFSHFAFSLFNFPDKYYHLIFAGKKSIPNHVAYLCPLCSNSFIVVFNDKFDSNMEFSLDHFPPACVGGTLKILTCKKCNNDAGGLYESELVNKMNYEANKNGKAKAKIKASFNADGVVGTYTSNLERNIDGTLVLDFSTQVIKKAPFLKEWVDKTLRNNNWEVKLTVKHPDTKKVLKAILKAAYLICFVNWGYDFIFSSNGSYIREVMNDKRDYPLDSVLWFDNLSIGSDVKLPLGLCIITEPSEFQSYVVNVPLEFNNYKCVASMLIPFPGENGIKRLEEIHKLLKSKTKVDITFKEQIVMPLASKCFDGYSKCWNDFIMLNKV